MADTVEETKVGAGTELGVDVSSGDVAKVDKVKVMEGDESDETKKEIVSPPGDVENSGDISEADDDDADVDDEEEGDKRTYLVDMPLSAQNRVRALRKNQGEIIDIETRFYKEMHELETKYEKLYQKKFDVRLGIVNGIHKPTEEECDYPLESQTDIPISIPSASVAKEGEDSGGIPMFWATVLRSAEPVASLIEDEDLCILKHLTDLRYVNTLEPMGFTLYFDFSTNEYFEDSVLTKSYMMKNVPDPENPLQYEGPEIIRCKGCPINWKQGKDITTSVVEKRQKHKKNGTIRTISKVVKMNSFFHFFNPPGILAKDSTTNEDDDDEVDVLNLDFEIGQALRERIIPRAILYFTGEALEDETDYATATDTEAEDEEDNEESEDEAIHEQGDQRSIAAYN